MNEDNNILENKIPEEGPNVQQSNSSKEIQVQVQEGLNQEEGNMNNITNELEDSGAEQMNEHMQKQAEELLNQGLQPDQDQEQPQNNGEEDNHEHEEQKNNEEEKKEESPNK